MNKITKFMESPITWGTWFKLRAIGVAISLVYSLVMLLPFKDIIFPKQEKTLKNDLDDLLFKVSTELME